MKKAVLQVQMFGGFSMIYEGKKLMFERNFTSKTAQLLQILFLHVNNGIAKESLLEFLYDRDDVENRNASLNNTIFRLRKQLETAGLPKGRYFTLNNGFYCWNQEVPAIVDVHSFEKKIEEGKRTEDETAREEILMEACSLYTGEFLPIMIGEDWVTVANTYYQKLYFEAIQEVSAWLMKKKCFEKLYELTTAALKIYPFEDWRLLQIDSLIAMNRYQDAIHIYKETTHLFFEELGLSPTPEMLLRFQLISERMQQSVSAIEEIKDDLKEKGERTGAYYCTFPSFIDIYHVVSRMMERTGLSVYIMLCTMTDSRGEIPIGAERNREASECLRNAIWAALRRCDFYTRYNENQFLIMLLGTKQENCQYISHRIDTIFKQNFNGRYKISYYVTSVAEFQGKEEGELKFETVASAWENKCF